jgi:hypothetical protein
MPTGNAVRAIEYEGPGAVKASVVLARAYGTQGYYGHGPRETPGDSPIVLPRFPKKPWTTTVALGDAVPWVLDACRLGRVITRTALTGSFGRSQSGEDDREVRALLADPNVGPSRYDWSWWITIMCESPIEVPDDEWIGRPYFWISPTVAADLAAQARRDVGSTLDVLAATIAGRVRNVVDSRPVIDGLYFRAPDRPTFPPLKVTMGTATISVSSPASSLDMKGLGRALRDNRAAIGELRSVAYWWARSIEEPDEWKRFSFQFLALEILTNKLANAAQKSVLPTLMAETSNGSDAVPPSIVSERVTLAGKFAFVALLLSPASALSDTADFERLAEVRNRLSHGALPLGSPLPHADAEGLLRKFLPLALSHAAHKS